MIALLLPFALQALVMCADEFYFHQRRGLPRWERIGHPLDTLTVTLSFMILAFLPPTDQTLKLYIALAAFSSLFVTKDEFIHAEECQGTEHWLHALMFVLHPTCFACAGWMWWNHEGLVFIEAQTTLLFAFGIYQVTYWNFFKQGLTANDQQ